MARWIKMPLGMELDLGPGDIVLDGDPTPPPPPKKRGAQHPQFWFMYSPQTAAWINMPLGTGRPRPRPHCVTWGPSSPSPKRGTAAPQFLAHVCCG